MGYKSVKLDPILTKAARLVKRKRYGEAYKFLILEVNRYRDSYYYYYILGLSCLNTMDYGGAFDFFRRARQLKTREPGALLGLAILFLRRGDTDKALDIYLEIINIDPENRRARKAMQIIRKYGEPELIQSYYESGRLKRLFPPPLKTPVNWRAVIFCLAAAAIACALSWGIYTFVKRPPKPGREGFEHSALEQSEKANLVQTGGTFKYILTEREVTDSFERARSLFNEKRDEAAKFEINRLLESNASEGVKNKARILLSYTETPGFESLKDKFSYKDVAKEPLLYRGCYVIWSGMAANSITEMENSTSFTLLVGYDTKTQLQGQVEVRFDKAIQIDSQRPLEVLGKVVPTADGLILEGQAIYQKP
jgi:tetratricopeptide (TPR) repeat protein